MTMYQVERVLHHDYLMVEKLWKRFLKSAKKKNYV